MNKLLRVLTVTPYETVERYRRPEYFSVCFLLPWSAWVLVVIGLAYGFATHP